MDNCLPAGLRFKKNDCRRFFNFVVSKLAIIIF